MTIFARTHEIVDNVDITITSARCICCCCCYHHHHQKRISQPPLLYCATMFYFILLLLLMEQPRLSTQQGNLDDDTGIPGAPLNLTAIPLTSSSIRLRWFRSGPVSLQQTFQVDAKPVGSSTYITVEPLLQEDRDNLLTPNKTKPMEYVVDKLGRNELSPSTAYLFRVKGKNQFDFGPESIVSNKTKDRPVVVILNDTLRYWIVDTRLAFSWKVISGEPDRIDLMYRNKANQQEQGIVHFATGWVIFVSYLNPSDEKFNKTTSVELSLKEVYQFRLLPYEGTKIILPIAQDQIVSLTPTFDEVDSQLTATTVERMAIAVLSTLFGGSTLVCIAYTLVKRQQRNKKDMPLTDFSEHDKSKSSMFGAGAFMSGDRRNSYFRSRSRSRSHGRSKKKKDKKKKKKRRGSDHSPTHSQHDSPHDTPTEVVQHSTDPWGVIKQTVKTTTSHPQVAVQQQQNDAWAALTSALLHLQPHLQSVHGIVKPGGAPVPASGPKPSTSSSPQPTPSSSPKQVPSSSPRDVSSASPHQVMSSTKRISTTPRASPVQSQIGTPVNVSPATSVLKAKDPSLSASKVEEETTEKTKTKSKKKSKKDKSSERDKKNDKSDTSAVPEEATEPKQNVTESQKDPKPPQQTSTQPSNTPSQIPSNAGVQLKKSKLQLPTESEPSSSEQNVLQPDEPNSSGSERLKPKSKSAKKTDTKLNTEAESKPDSNTGSKPESTTQSTPESTTLSKPEPSIVSKPKFKVRNKPISKSGTQTPSPSPTPQRKVSPPPQKPDATLDTGTESKPDSSTGSKPQTSKNSKLEPSTESKPESSMLLKPDLSSGSNPESSTGVKPESNTKPKPAKIIRTRPGSQRQSPAPSPRERLSPTSGSPATNAQEPAKNPKDPKTPDS